MTDKQGSPPSHDCDEIRSVDEQDPKLVATAYHEAGHAVMAISLGRLINKVNIEPGRSHQGSFRLGVCKMRKGRSRTSRNEFEDDALIILAGMVAESQFTGQYCAVGAGQDLRMVTRTLQQKTNNEKQFDRMFKRMLNKTEHLLGEDSHAHAIELIANELIEKKSISGRAVQHFFDLAIKKFE